MRRQAKRRGVGFPVAVRQPDPLARHAVSPRTRQPEPHPAGDTEPHPLRVPRTELLIMRVAAPVTVLPRKRRGVELVLIIFALMITLGGYAIGDFNITG